MQVLPDGSALATVEDISNIGMVVLFLADEEISYYDDQKINVPTGKRVMQIGTYKYITRSEMGKTFLIMDTTEGFPCNFLLFTHVIQFDCIDTKSVF